MNYQQAEKIYKALANRRRLAIIDYLAREKRANVGDIANEINLSFKSTSRHLQQLKSLDLVNNEQVSIQQYYFLTDMNNSFIKHTLSIL